MTRETFSPAKLKMHDGRTWEIKLQEGDGYVRLMMGAYVVACLTSRGDIVRIELPGPSYELNGQIYNKLTGLRSVDNGLGEPVIDVEPI